jgi:cell division protein FtsX
LPAVLAACERHVLRSAVAAAAFVAATAGCGVAREAAPARCVVRVYFCTASTCSRPARKAQVSALSSRLRRDPDVYSVRFVSKREALRIMRKQYPDETADLPWNPFPDSLRVRPVKDVAPARIARRIRPGEKGVHAVNVSRDPACA